MDVSNHMNNLADALDSVGRLKTLPQKETLSKKGLMQRKLYLMKLMLKNEK